MAVRLSALHALPSKKDLLVIIFVRRWVDPRATVRLEGLGKLEKVNNLLGNRTHDLPACRILSEASSYCVPPELIQMCSNLFTGWVTMSFTLSKYTCNRNWDYCHFILVYSQHVSAPWGEIQCHTFEVPSILQRIRSSLIVYLCGVSHLVYLQSEF
jgi:hypothetical protein